MDIETGIDGLKIKFNKVNSDERGVLCEIAKPENDDFLKFGIKNIYASIATGKNVPRAGHFHFKNVENFYTLSGTALWIFKDYRKDSPTFGKMFKIILGFNSPEGLSKNIDVVTIDKSQMAQILVPNGVYHIYWPMNDEKVIVLALASENYDEKDYWRADNKEMESINKIAESVLK